MKILALLVISLLFTISAQSAVVTEDLGSCINYSILNKVEVNGEFHLPTITENQTVTNEKKDHYGLYLKKLSIDFTSQTASAELKQAIIFGFNRKLLTERISISSSHPQFNQFINEINKNVVLIRSICIDRDNMVVSYKVN